MTFCKNKPVAHQAGLGNVKPLRVGVPTMDLFKKFVEVKYDERTQNLTYSGYSVELFKETVKRLPYISLMNYEFYPSQKQIWWPFGASVFEGIKPPFILLTSYYVVWFFFTLYFLLGSFHIYLAEVWFSSWWHFSSVKATSEGLWW